MRSLNKFHNWGQNEKCRGFYSHNIFLKVMDETMKFHLDVDVINRKGKIKFFPVFN
jgi:hypothetical protein